MPSLRIYIYNHIIQIIRVPTLVDRGNIMCCPCLELITVNYTTISRIAVKLYYELHIKKNCCSKILLLLSIYLTFISECRFINKFNI